MLHQRGRADGDLGRRRVDGNGCHGGNRNGSSVGRRKNDRDVGRSAGGSDLKNLGGGRQHNDLGGGRRDLDNLRAGISLVSVVGTGTELGVGTAGDANVVASTGILLGAHAGTARAVRLAVGTSAELDSRTAGNADVETGTGILLAVTSGRSGVMGRNTAENRKTVLGCSVSVVIL